MTALPISKALSQMDPVLQVFAKQHEKHLHQKELSQALVYLKLRGQNCNSKTALRFAKRKQKNIDGTVQKDGPPGFRNLQPIKRQQRQLVNGWVKGQKLQYQDAISYSRQIEQLVSKQKRSISQFNKRDRDQQNKRRDISKGYGLKRWIDPAKVKQSQQLKKQQKIDLKASTMMKTSNLQKTKTNSLLKQQKVPSFIQKIFLIKQDIMKEKQIKSLNLAFKGEKLNQMTKDYIKNLEENKSQGLIAKLGLFDRFNQQNKQEGFQIIAKEGNDNPNYKKRVGILDFRKSLHQWNPQIKSNSSRTYLGKNTNEQQSTKMKIGMRTNSMPKIGYLSSINFNNTTKSVSKNKKSEKELNRKYKEDIQFQQDLQKITQLLLMRKSQPVFNSLVTNNQNVQQAQKQTTITSYLMDKVWQC